MREPAVIIGGSIASLVAALSAARSGRRTTLFCDPARVGAGFSGVKVDHRHFDLGTRLFELEYEGEDRRPITDFRPDHDGHRPFIDDIARFIRSICGDHLRAAPDPEMWIAGRRIKCPLMTVDLTDLARAVSPADRASILRDCRTLPPVTAPGDESLMTASLARHGQRLHDLIIRVTCGKQWEHWGETMASERRKLWAALFHPQTICEVFAGEPVTFQPHRPFAMLRSGQAFHFVRRLIQLVQASHLITLRPVSAPTYLQVAAGTLTVRFGDTEALSFPAQQTAIGLSAEQLFAAAAIPFEQARITSSLLWCEVPRGDLRQVPSCLTIADPELTAFRLSSAGPEALCIEFGAALCCLEGARAALEATGTIRPGSSLRALHQLTGPAQPAPSKANRDRFAEAIGRFNEFGFAGSLLGAARRFGWGSLNDQIADGLYYGATRC
jgi:hypothetical protein